jgi:hypothetical protein
LAPQPCLRINRRSTHFAFTLTRTRSTRTHDAHAHTCAFTLALALTPTLAPSLQDYGTAKDLFKLEPEEEFAGYLEIDDLCFVHGGAPPSKNAASTWCKEANVQAEEAPYNSWPPFVCAKKGDAGAADVFVAAKTFGDVLSAAQGPTARTFVRSDMVFEQLLSGVDAAVTANDIAWKEHRRVYAHQNDHKGIPDSKFDYDPASMPAKKRT